jgi:hypothetical protein
MSSSFRPVGVPALAFSIVAIVTVFVPHIGLSPHELKPEGGNHLVALFMFLPIAATLYGLMALTVVFAIRFLIGQLRAMNPPHRSNETDAINGSHDTSQIIDASHSPSPDSRL